MSEQEQELTVTKTVSENPEIQTTDANLTLNNDEKFEKPTPSLENNVVNESEPIRRITISQDIRYAAEQGDRDKLMKKYANYQVSDTDACYVRFMADNRQKKNLLGRYEEENSNLYAIAKTFGVNTQLGYKNNTRCSFKVVGTEANVRKCLIQIISRMYKQQNQSSIQPDTENNNQSTTATNIEKSSETTEVSTDNEKVEDKTFEPTSVFVTTINPDASIRASHGLGWVGKS